MSTDLNSYKYYLSGRKIAILAYDEETALYLTPTEADTAAIMLEYTLAAGSVTNETDSIDVDTNLERALVYYVKARLAEDQGRDDIARIQIGKFYMHLSRSQNNKLGIDARISIPRGITVLK